MQALIFHGNEGTPQKNWYSWLGRELEKVGMTCHVPQLPSEEEQTPERWLAFLKQYKITPDTILIGHSLGGTFILYLLESLNINIKAAYLVCTPLDGFNNPEFEVLKPFLVHEFNWEQIRKRASLFKVYQSNDDPYVIQANSEELAKKLGVTLTIIPNAGHFRAKDGYAQFPVLLEEIKKII